MTSYEEYLSMSDAEKLMVCDKYVGSCSKDGVLCNLNPYCEGLTELRWPRKRRRELIHLLVYVILLLLVAMSIAFVMEAL